MPRLALPYGNQLSNKYASSSSHTKIDTTCDRVWHPCSAMVSKRSSADGPQKRAHACNTPGFPSPTSTRMRDTPGPTSSHCMTRAWKAIRGVGQVQVGAGQREGTQTPWPSTHCHCQGSQDSSPALASRMETGARPRQRGQPWPFAPVAAVEAHWRKAPLRTSDHRGV